MVSCQIVFCATVAIVGPLLFLFACLIVNDSCLSTPLLDLSAFDDCLPDVVLFFEFQPNKLNFNPTCSVPESCFWVQVRLQVLTLIVHLNLLAVPQNHLCVPVPLRQFSITSWKTSLKEKVFLSEEMFMHSAALRMHGGLLIKAGLHILHWSETCQVFWAPWNAIFAITSVHQCSYLSEVNLI